MSKSGWAEQPPIRDMARIRFNRSTCQISGTYVPVAEMKLHDEDSVYFSHHVLLHTESERPAGHDADGRRLEPDAGGMPLIMMTARGPGHVAISADHPGETLAVPLPANHAIDVVEHRFLVATGERRLPLGELRDLVHHPERRRPGVRTTRSARRWTGSRRQGGPGLLLLHAPGNTFIRDLQPGERILVQPSGLIWKDPSVRMFLHFEYPHGNYWFSSARWQAKSIWLTLQGPGRVAIQSVFEQPERTGPVRTVPARPPSTGNRFRGITPAPPG